MLHHRILTELAGHLAELKGPLDDALNCIRRLRAHIATDWESARVNALRLHLDRLSAEIAETQETVEAVRKLYPPQKGDQTCVPS